MAYTLMTVVGASSLLRGAEMQANKQTTTVKDAKTGRQIQWLAKTSLSDRGAVTVMASDALNSVEVKAQLEAVKRIREKLKR
jgi:hypothetical protein